MSRLSPLPLRLLLLGVLVVVAPACGKRGPPLPPLHPAPDKVTGTTFVRHEGDVTVNFLTPIKNVDGSTPFLLDRIEIYALTAAAGTVTPTVKKVFDPKNRIAIVGQKPPATPKAGATDDAAADDDEVPVAVPLSFTERVAMVMPGRELAPLPIVRALFPIPTTTPAPAAAPTASPFLPSPTRFYLMVPYANRSRIGALSDMTGVPIGPVVPPAPAKAAIKYDETTLTLSWTTPIPTQTVHVYDASARAVPNAKPLTVTPVTALEWKRPVEFGKEVCFAVRIVRGTAPVFFESAPSNVICETPDDHFPPSAPSGLIAFATDGSIGLTWDGVTAADLAGYIVLRGEGTSETLQPLMTKPISGTAFSDTTARSGVRYTYAVVAVDSATPANRSKESNRVEETGRHQ